MGLYQNSQEGILWTTTGSISGNSFYATIPNQDTGVDVIVDIYTDDPNASIVSIVDSTPPQPSGRQSKRYTVSVLGSPTTYRLVLRRA